MNKEKWQGMTDDQKSEYMRNVFAALNFGPDYDYAADRKRYEQLHETDNEVLPVYENPCIVLRLFDPVMTCRLFQWMYGSFDDAGNKTKYTKGEPAPLFGYEIIELVFDKHSLMDFSYEEKQILREAMRIIGQHVTKHDEEGGMPGALEKSTAKIGTFLDMAKHFNYFSQKKWRVAFIPQLKQWVFPLLTHKQQRATE